jgi:Na+/melibiose symporter-like transporter
MKNTILYIVYHSCGYLMHLDDQRPWKGSSIILMYIVIVAVMTCMSVNIMLQYRVDRSGFVIYRNKK